MASTLGTQWRLHLIKSVRTGRSDAGPEDSPSDDHDEGMDVLGPRPLHGSQSGARPYGKATLTNQRTKHVGHEFQTSALPCS